MSVRRVMGIETEYGISVPGQPGANAMVTSSQVVNAYHSEAAAQASAIPGTAPIQLYKNNTDNKGASYGCHENYLMSRATPFAEIVRYLTPFFVTRQVICGAGRV